MTTLRLCNYTYTLSYTLSGDGGGVACRQRVSSNHLKMWTIELQRPSDLYERRLLMCLCAPASYNLLTHLSEITELNLRYQTHQFWICIHENQQQHQRQRTCWALCLRQYYTFELVSHLYRQQSYHFSSSLSLFQFDAFMLKLSQFNGVRCVGFTSKVHRRAQHTSL